MKVCLGGGNAQKRLALELGSKGGNLARDLLYIIKGCEQALFYQWW